MFQCYNNWFDSRRMYCTRVLRLKQLVMSYNSISRFSRPVLYPDPVVRKKIWSLALWLLKAGLSKISRGWVSGTRRIHEFSNSQHQNLLSWALDLDFFFYWEFDQIPFLLRSSDPWIKSSFLCLLNQASIFLS